MIIIDTEATGLMPVRMAPITQHPYMMEFFGLKVDDVTLEETDRLHLLVRPPIPIPDVVTKITGITTNMLNEASPFALHYWTLVDFFLGERIVAAHNAPYDLGVLAAELERLDKLQNFPWPARHACTVELTQNFTGKYLKLSELYQILFERPLAQTHRAESDVMALRECIGELKARDQWITPLPARRAVGPPTPDRKKGRRKATP